jgi:hypothetical protein
VKNRFRFVVALIGLAVAGRVFTPKVALGAPPSCDPATVAAAQAAIAAACPCAGVTDAMGNVQPWKNHGAYVRCVAHATTKATRPPQSIARRCLRDSVSCGARSTCGKPDFVACRVPVPHTCVGDPVPGDGTAAGTCDNDASVKCDTDADCTTQHCSTRASADSCTAVGGTPSSGSCCQ